MDLEWIKTFLSAAETENFREAARQRFVNQTTVSHHIAHLEAEIGTPLFLRNGRRVTLTKAGSIMVPYAERLIHLAQEGIQESAKVSQTNETLTLAASFYAAEVLLPWLCQALTRSHPDLDIEVLIVSPADAIKAIVEGSCDAALVQEGAHRAGVVSQPLVDDRLVLIAAPDGGDIDTVPPSWQTLLTHKRLLVQSDNRYWVPIREILATRGASYRTMEVNDIALTKKLVAADVGISVVPELSVTREMIEGRLLGLYPSWLESLSDTLTWIRSKDRAASTAVLHAERLLQRRFPRQIE